MNIKIYGMHGCGKCEMVKKVLNNKGVDYEYVDDAQRTLDIAIENSIRVAPVCVVDAKTMNSEDFLALVKDFSREDGAVK